MDDDDVDDDDDGDDDYEDYDDFIQIDVLVSAYLRFNQYLYFRIVFQDRHDDHVNGNWWWPHANARFSLKLEKQAKSE